MLSWLLKYDIGLNCVCKIKIINPIIWECVMEKSFIWQRRCRCHQRWQWQQQQPSEWTSYLVSCSVILCFFLFYFFSLLVLCYLQIFPENGPDFFTLFSVLCECILCVCTRVRPFHSYFVLIWKDKKYVAMRYFCSKHTHGRISEDRERKRKKKWIE